jgi:hypothetical protein
MTHGNKEIGQTGRIVAFLTRPEIDFIDSLSKDALFSTGRKLSRTDIIRAMVDAIKIKQINANGVFSKTDLEKRLLELMKAALPKTAIELQKKRLLNEDI